MTEQEWLACEEPQKMLSFLRGRASNRKLRLFACACCRLIWDLLTDERSRKAVELAEQSADELVSPESLDAASAEAEEVAEDATETLVCGDYEDEAGAQAAEAAAHAASYASNTPVRECDVVEVTQAVADAAPVGVLPELAALLRHIVGNPFRPMPRLAPSLLTWNDALVVRMANSIYDERILPSGELDPARLAVLADALEDAGCTDAELLGHLRGEGVHVRGYWVIDLLTGRT